MSFVPTVSKLGCAKVFHEYLTGLVRVDFVSEITPHQKFPVNSENINKLANAIASLTTSILNFDNVRINVLSLGDEVKIRWSDDLGGECTFNTAELLTQLCPELLPTLFKNRENMFNM